MHAFFINLISGLLVSIIGLLFPATYKSVKTIVKMQRVKKLMLLELKDIHQLDTIAISNKIRKLNYYKEKEISHIKYGKFESIMIIDATIDVLNIIKSIKSSYGFHQPTKSDGLVRKEENILKELGVNYYLDCYQKNLNDYVKLKIHEIASSDYKDEIISKIQNLAE